MAKTWTADEVLEFRRVYPGRRDESLAKRFGATMEEVQALARRFALHKDKAIFPGGQMPRWTAAEVERLRELYPTTPNLEIARALGRSLKSVNSKAHNLGLSKAPARLEDMGRENVQKRFRRDEFVIFQNGEGEVSSMP